MVLGWSLILIREYGTWLQYKTVILCITIMPLLSELVNRKHNYCDVKCTFQYFFRLNTDYNNYSKYLPTLLPQLQNDD